MRWKGLWASLTQSSSLSVKSEDDFASHSQGTSKALGCPVLWFMETKSYTELFYH